MPTLSVETIRTGGVTFVEVLVDAERPHRVRVETRLDGPVWPPREDGRPAEGWDRSGVSTVVDAGTTALGFATPASPDGTVVELVDAEPTIGADLPVGITAWLGRVERRVELGEALAGVDDVRSATEAVATVGGLSGVERLAAELARDRRTVAELSFVPDELTRRLEAVELPATALTRLATR